MKDHRDNPKLHQLHVTYAQEELQIYQEMIDRLSSFSRVNPSIMCGIIMEERAKIIRDDAAYQEAAWRILSNDLLVPEDEDIKQAETP